MLAEWALFGIKIRTNFVLVDFVASISDRISPSTVKAFELISIDRELIRFEVVVLANQRARLPGRLGALVVGWSQWFHGQR